MPQALEEQVYMHPLSAMAKAAPELIAYMQIVRTAKRPYMTGMQQSSFLQCTTLAMKRAYVFFLAYSSHKCAMHPCPPQFSLAMEYI
jgi:hypothetical protein